jgi:hypothetical protein
VECGDARGGNGRVRKELAAGVSDLRIQSAIRVVFPEMHTENFDSNELIRAAVVSQLAKSAVERSDWIAFRPKASQTIPFCVGDHYGKGKSIRNDR